MEEPAAVNQWQARHAQLLARCYRELTGRELFDPSEFFPTSAADLGRALYHADFVLLSHDTQPDPLFTYGNLAAQRLFEMGWRELTALPSRLSAEAPARHERERLLEKVSADGFIDDYRGVRVSRTGRRFLIDRATVWNLTDSATGKLIGQAAWFSDWTPLGRR